MLETVFKYLQKDNVQGTINWQLRFLFYVCKASLQGTARPAPGQPPGAYDREPPLDIE